MKKLYILSVLLVSAGITFGQTYEDVLRFSRQSTVGTARSAAMGGAFGALGGDLSSFSINPAGIGVFRKSEVGFTPLLTFGSIESGSRTANKNSFQIGNLGGVVSFYNPNFDWRGFNFGISYTNLNNYNHKMDLGVANSETSQLDVYALESGFADPKNLSSFTTGLAYDAYLTYRTTDGNYYSVLETGGKPELVNQYKLIKEDGYQGEYAFAFGTNYKDKLYLGLTIGLQAVYYKMRSVYTEIGEENAPSGFDSYDFYTYEKINGVGTNFKFGAIYRPIPELRIGASIHTPTWYNMNYSYETGIDSYFNTPQDPTIGREKEHYGWDSPLAKYDYDMRTPWRAVLSVATVLMQKAILSVDYEYVDYASAKFTGASDDYSYQNENQDIKDTYGSGHNLRIGAEYRLNSQFSLRGGYSYQGSPYKYKGYNFVNFIPGGNKIQTVSAGFGLNFGQFYCDAAYTYKFAKDETVFYFYQEKDFTVLANPVKNKYRDHQARISLGVRF